MVRPHDLAHDRKAEPGARTNEGHRDGRNRHRSPRARSSRQKREHERSAKAHVIHGRSAKDKPLVIVVRK
jgi:hypothetical protein